jgi:hypothetical protein
MSNEWRERIAEQRRALVAARRAQLAADPRVQAMKRALKERRHAAYEQQKKWRKNRVQQQKQQQHERALDERAQRDAALAKMVRPATTPDDGG